MLDQFLEYNKKNNLFTKNDRILLAVSGGIDSMVMAHMFLKAGSKNGIAHCNFCLRGKESDKDEEFVRDFAAVNGIPFYSIRFKTKEYSREKGISVQMAARELRYGWFEEMRSTNKYDLVAVAHNLNDKIETLLINLIRGTGLTGLTGIRVRTKKIIRPLLFASRHKIEEYCRSNNIEYREDVSNAETRYVRNKIRHNIIPLLREINPSVEETLSVTADRLSVSDEVLNEYISNLRLRLLRLEGNKTIFDVEGISDIHPDKSLLYELFSPYGITGSTSSDLLKILSGQTGKRIETKTHRILRNRKELIVSPLESRSEQYFLINSPDDLLSVPGIIKAEKEKINKGFIIPSDRNIACIDLGKISFPLVVRTWREGDLFYPLGMKGKKKLSDYFTDRKFSVDEKENVLLIESEGRIVWIINERLDNRFRISRSTTEMLQIVTEEKGN